MSFEQIELPYKEIGAGASRDDIRDAGKAVGAKIGRQTFMIPFDRIFIRDGFNVRDSLGDIDELAADIKANGLQDPLVLDLVAGKGKPRYVVDIGHRRQAALELLRKDGSLKTLNLHGIREGMVECFINQTSVDELVRIKRLFSSNHHKPLEPLEISRVVGRMKRYYKMSHQAIGESLGMSRQKVDMYILIDEASDDLKESIRAGGMKVTAAVALIRGVKDATRRDEIARETKETSRKVKVSDVPGLKLAGEKIDEHEFDGPEEEEDDDQPWHEWKPTGAAATAAAEEEEEGGATDAFTQPEQTGGIAALLKDTTAPHGPLPEAPRKEASTEKVKQFLDASNPEAENKDEFQMCNRVISNLDKISFKVGLVRGPGAIQLAEEVDTLIQYAQKDLEKIREYVKNCRK